MLADFLDRHEIEPVPYALDLNPQSKKRLVSTRNVQPPFSSIGHTQSRIERPIVEQ